MNNINVGVTEAAVGIILGFLAVTGTLGAFVWRALTNRRSRGIRRLKTEEVEKAKAEHAEATEALEEDRRIAREEAKTKLAGLEEALSNADPGKRADALTDLHNQQKDRDA